MKKIFVINGSASKESSNHRLIEYIRDYTNNYFNIELFDKLKTLPHFDPELSIENTPLSILEFRQKVQDADGVLICTPEYIFSIPSGLKNAIEWCVSTMVFTEKPLGIITASASGEFGHIELQKIMQTLSANFSTETTLLIQGIKGKIDLKNEITDIKTKSDIINLLLNYKKLMDID